MKLLAFTLAALMAMTAAAQTPPPPAPKAPEEMPAELPSELPADIPFKAPATPGTESPLQVQEGTTLIGETESPLGLVIMPWRGSVAETGLDRPARLLDDALLPMDDDVFHRQVLYHRALSEHLAKTGRDTP